MKRLLQFVVALLVIHAVGAGAFVGWFYMTRMNEQYADVLGRMLRGEELELAGDGGAVSDEATTQPASLTADDVQEQEQIALLEADIAKRKAFDWVLERVAVVDEDGATVDRASLEPPTADTVPEGSEGPEGTAGPEGSEGPGEEDDE